MNDAHNRYKQTAVQSASREKILLMLYEGAIKFTKRAITACEKNDIAGRGYNISRAMAIVNELSNSLNHEVGGELSKNLEQLYMFITDQFVQANVSGHTKHLNDSLRILEILENGWGQAIEKLKREGKIGKSA